MRNVADAVPSGYRVSGKKTFPARLAGGIFFLAGFLFFIRLQAQAPADVPDISKIQSEDSIGRSVLFTTAEKKTVADQDIPSLHFAQKIPDSYRHGIPLVTTGKTIFLKFPLYNGADTTLQVYFYPGLNCRQIEVFKSPADSARAMLIPMRSDAKGFALIGLQPKEKAWVYARLDYVLTTVTSLSPKIIRKNFLPYFKIRLLHNKTTINLLNYITSGILLMMIFYSIAVYLQSSNKEFIYYCGYAFCMALLLFLKSYLFGANSAFNHIFEAYLDFMIQMTGYYFYLLFFMKFLNTKKDHPFLEKVFRLCSWAIVLSLLLFSIFYFSSASFSVINLVENITKQMLLVVSLVFIFYGLWKKDPLMNYLVTGQLFLTFFSVISFLLLITTIRLSPRPDSAFNDSLLYYEIGLVLELIFFMAGLSYKNKRDLIERIKERERLKLDNERKEFEKQVAILEAKQQERNRISADMHDELGSGVTAIRLMSEIVKSKMKENTLPEIEKISQSANDLLNKMNTIIWTMVSSNDTVESLVAYIRAYAVEFFENTPIECRFEMVSSPVLKEMSGEKRRNVFLCVKEALNNVLKHSNASVVQISISVNSRLSIEIADNGTGFNIDQVRKFGNGLQNMKKRIASVSGEFRIENHNGTKAFFELEL